MTVTGTLQKVWSLWPSIGEMARDLNESPRVLIEAREADALPDPRHDDALLVRSLWCGTKLDRAMLEHARLRQNTSKARQIIKSERTAEIQAFYDACGGIPVLAKRLGVTNNYLHLAKSRAYLPRVAKYEMMKEAERNGHDLSERLFEPLA
jgi:hypothetical protein